MNNKLIKALTGFCYFFFGWPIVIGFLFITFPLFALLGAFFMAKDCYTQNVFPGDLNYAEDSYDEEDNDPEEI